MTYWTGVYVNKYRGQVWVKWVEGARHTWFICGWSNILWPDHQNVWILGDNILQGNVSSLSSRKVSCSS